MKRQKQKIKLKTDTRRTWGVLKWVFWPAFQTHKQLVTQLCAALEVMHHTVGLHLCECFLLPSSEVATSGMVILNMEPELNSWTKEKWEADISATS